VDDTSSLFLAINVLKITYYFTQTPFNNILCADNSKQIII